MPVVNPRSALYKWLIDPGERALWTFIQASAVILLAYNISLGQHWKQAIVTGLFAALISFVTALAGNLASITLVGLADLIRRIVVTVLATFVGSLISSNVSTDPNVNWKTALAAALMAGLLAALKAGAGLNWPSTLGGSWKRVTA